MCCFLSGDSFSLFRRFALCPTRTRKYYLCLSCDSWDAHVSLKGDFTPILSQTVPQDSVDASILDVGDRDVGFIIPELQCVSGYRIDCNNCVKTKNGYKISQQIVTEINEILSPLKYHICLNSNPSY